MRINNYPYLKDSDFLQQIDKLKIANHYAKIIVLNWDENPIQDIQGRIISGSINIDGTSSMRRTCNLSLYSEGKEDESIYNTENLISINKKIYLEIGVENLTNSYLEYPIIWFPCGIYVIIDASVSSAVSGVSISLQLKDKMCLLNGECGGTISASTQFDEYDIIEYNEDGTSYTTIYKPTIYQIIQELVNHFGGEQLGKIIISDLETRIKKVMKWGGTNPIYIAYGTDGKVMKYQTEAPIVETVGTKYPPGTITTFKTDSEEPKYHYWENSNSILINVKIYEYGADIGFIYSDFYFPSELTASPGDTVVSVLDTIKNTLGNYEYFYDLEGNFIFQEIKNYVNTSFTTTQLDVLDYQVNRKGRKTVYDFDNSEILISCSASPQYANIKNDFLVWGSRKNVDGIEIPIRYHLAINKKPNIGNEYQVFFYEDIDDKIKKAKVPFNCKTTKNIDNPIVGSYYYATEEDKIYRYLGEKFKEKRFQEIDAKIQTIITKDWRTELYLQGVIAENLGLDTGFYYTELVNEWPKMYDIEKGEFYYSTTHNPSGLDYYLDFIDTFAEIGEFGVNNIGRRTKVSNDDSVNCIFESDVPDCILIETGQITTEEYREECEEKGQTYYLVKPYIYDLLSAGGQQNSAYEAIKNLLFLYTHYNTSISISCLPIYYLEPNTRITINEKTCGINEDYIISSMSIPLDSNGTMTISATLATERL